MGSFEVRLWSIRKRKGRSPFQLRWIVGDVPQAESFLTRALAESFRGDLLKAMRAGEEFDPVTGRPMSWGKETSWHDHCRDFAASRWAGSAGGSRKGRAAVLAAVTVVLVTGKRGCPDPVALRRALTTYAYGPRGVAVAGPNGTTTVPRPDVMPADVAAILAWVEKNSPPVTVLRDLATVRRVLDALAVNLNGKPAAGHTIATRRSLFYNAVGRAVEHGLLASNPLDAVQWTRPTTTRAINRRVVANPSQVMSIIAKVPEVAPRAGGGLVAFYGCLYFAGMRPSEAVGLNIANCYLPEEGWGWITLDGSDPYTGVLWGDSGEARERSSLKHRADGEARGFPAAPQLVAMLRHHIDTYGVAPDGRLFRTSTGGKLQSSEYRRIWSKAREKALTAEQAASPLARRPYDLRHACASTWLAAGVPVTDIAERLGHSVEMLLKVYAACIDGNTEQNNARISVVLDGALSGTQALVLTLWGNAVTSGNEASEERAEGPIAA